MKKLLAAVLSVMMIFSLAACNSETQDNSSAPSSTPEASSAPEATTPVTTESDGPTTVEITDVRGTVTVPVNPERIVSLDNRTYDTLHAWGVKLLAVPKGVMPADSPYVLDESVQDVGSLREPNLEVIAAVDPEVVIIGQRFASNYDEIKALVPNAVLIDLTFDVSEKADSPAENFVNGFIDTTTALGMIFEKQAEAAALIADFEKSIEDVRSAYNGEDTIVSVIISGGDIGYSAPGSGRVWGPMYEIFDWVSPLDVSNTTSDHQGDEINIEAIAQSNPDWFFVLDRDAGVAGTDSLPAKDVIDNSPALQNTTAVMEGNIVYAPNDTYTNESIQTYIKLFGNIAAAFENK